MDMNTIVTIIGTVGFPIVACILIGWYCKYMTDKNSEDLKAIRDQHDNEMKHVTEALNNNTLIMQKLSDKLDNLFYDRKDP